MGSLLWSLTSWEGKPNRVAQRFLTHCKEGWTEQAKSDITVQAHWVGSGDPAVTHHRHSEGSESVISASVHRDSQSKLYNSHPGMGGGRKRVKCSQYCDPEQRATVWGPQCLCPQKTSWMPNVAH